MLVVENGAVELPLLTGTFPAPTFATGSPRSTESAEGVGWEIRDDVLTRTTTAATRQTGTYPTPHDGSATEIYLGEVSVNRQTFHQRVHADTTFDLSWPGIDITVRSIMDIQVTGDEYLVTIETVATRDSVEVSRRAWEERIRRGLDGGE
jgi:uncharacterized protein